MARLPYLQREDLTPEAQAVHDEIAQSRGRLPRPFAVLLHSPEAARRVAALGEYVRYRSAVPRHLAELAILAVARELDCQYEFTYHAAHARRAGLAEESIAAVAQRRAPQGLPEEEALVVRFAQELLRQRRFSDATWEEALARFGRVGATDLAVTVGYYTMMAHFLLGFEVELEEGTAPALPL